MSAAVGLVASTALLVACGCPDEHLDEVYRHLGFTPLPGTHEALVKQARVAIAEVLARHD